MYCYLAKRELNYSFHFTSGKSNVVADAFNRAPGDGTYFNEGEEMKTETNVLNIFCMVNNN